MGSRLEKNSELVRKRFESHKFEDEEGDEYEGSKFGGFADYFRRKKIKLQNLDADIRSSTAGNAQIFKGVCCHVNGYTQPSLNDLHHMIVSYGGVFMQYLDGKTTVTHIIASNLTPKKAIEFRRYRIVKPAWVVDSITAGKLLPWNSYRVLDEGVGQRVLAFDEGKVVSQARTQSRTYREQTKTSWYTSQVKNMAENIDDEAGAQFPSSQAVVLNGTGMYTDSSGQQPSKSIVYIQPNKRAEVPSSSQSLDASSPLKDALANAATGIGSGGIERLESFLKTSHIVPEKNATVTNPLTTPTRTSKVVLRDEMLESPTPQKSPINTPQKLRYDLTNLESPTPSPPKRVKLLADLESPTPSPPRQAEILTAEEPVALPPTKAKVLTAEEHNAILLADPHIRKSSTANPDFLKQYYSESRLHHLSAWKAELKSRCQRMAAEKSASQKQSLKRKPGSRRYIIHVDFDSFFCAVSLKSTPEYVDKPAVVAHGAGTGSEIASCNYPARAFGVKNGMWMKQALKLCPNIKVLPYDFPAYEEASKGFYEAILDVGGIIQSVSVDEALVDVSTLCLPAEDTDGFSVREGSVWREQEKADRIAQGLRTRIKEKTGCAVSVGIGGNILLAKVALRKAKPAGQHQIKPEEVLNFIAELSVQDLPGVAYSIGGKLEEIGVKSVKDVRQMTQERLITLLGPKTGKKLWDYSRGIDKTEVGEQVVRKSVSAEVNWGIRFLSQPEAEEFVQNLCTELQRRLVNEQVRGRQLTVKIMRKSAEAPLDPPKHLGHGKCDTFNKSIVLGVATNSAGIIGREAISILRSYGFSPGELRGLGVQMTKLDPIKSFGDALPDGSQRRLNFGVSAPRLVKQITEDPIDDSITPKKAKSGQPSSGPSQSHLDPIDESPTSRKPKAISSQALRQDDPIFLSPQKPRETPVHPATAISRANASDYSARKYLNMTGTQFIMPSQIDPEVLAELPPDIRSKLVAQGRKETKPRSPSPKTQSPIPRAARETSNPPLPSQVDPEVFESLPAELQTEILASYSANQAIFQAQSLLPQSPRKLRTIQNLKKTTPTKKQGPLFRSRASKQDPYSTSTQSNFVADQKDDSDYNSDTLDESFLSALPPDMQEEIIQEHRRKWLAKKRGLMTSALKDCHRPPDQPPAIQRKIRLPLRDPKPTFTTRGLSTLPELRETLKEWFEEFREDGPIEDDVKAMERYLRRVVVEERDLGKVVGVVRWMQWLVDDADGATKTNGKGLEAWSLALEGVREQVQFAVHERGLGTLDL
ncbi:hypothetical protein BJ875DRAFT_450446 [Amylocarpus encephaloides]|uniref:DNA repair protein REV1 n=1 Tax=Amylocarpus encephaloides TaxID=45428 RepID=A0A9P7YS09_9HELO|nr:hypothetical protein BJ875DRAFT_450446 [Amylocarpus encephaloides]